MDYRKAVIDGIKEFKEYDDYKEIVKFLVEIELKEIDLIEEHKYLNKFREKFPEEMFVIEGVNNISYVVSNRGRIINTSKDNLLNFLIRIFLLKASKTMKKDLTNIDLDNSLNVFTIYNEYKNKIDNMKKIKVVAALIEKDNKYLIARRSTGDVNMLGRWEFPGGKVEPNEDELSAIEREIREEFELEVIAIKFISNNICEYPDKIVDLRLYECKYISGEFKLHDHSEYKFVSKDEIVCYDLCPADVPLAEYVKETM